MPKTKKKADSMSDEEFMRGLVEAVKADCEAMNAIHAELVKEWAKNPIKTDYATGLIIERPFPIL